MSVRTKVMEPLRWALPPVPVRREIVSCPPAQPTDRPPLLFVHGLSHAAWSWELWMAAAGERGFQTHAVNLRGHGASDGHDRIRRWKLRDYEHDVMQTIIDLPSPPVLIGHSMGALVVRRILARYPAAAGVLIAPAGARHGLGVLGRLARFDPVNAARALTLQPVRLRARNLFADIDAAEAARYEQLIEPDSPLVQLEIVASPRPAGAAAPVLVLGGEKDNLVPVADVIATARAYGTRAHIFRGMGHDLMLERRWRAPLGVVLTWIEQQELRR